METLCLCCLVELLPVMVSHRANKMDRKIGTVVGPDIGAEELSEILYDKVT